MIFAVFHNSGFKRTLCGGQWDPVNGIPGSVSGNKNAFDDLGTSTARHGCCPANKYMSSPFITFVEADSCSSCPAGTHVSLATSIPNDETSCMLLGVYDKMHDGCKGVTSSSDRSCDPRQAVDDLNADGSGAHATYGPMKDWDMSLVTDISYLFYNKGTMNADLSSWDVSRVTTMKSSTLTFQFQFFCLLFFVVLFFIVFHFIITNYISLILFPILFFFGICSNFF